MATLPPETRPFPGRSQSPDRISPHHNSNGTSLPARVAFGAAVWFDVGAMETTEYVLNREAMSIPEDGLVDALHERVEAKREVLAERDRQFGADRVPIGSYMENIGWPGLFGFDMNRYFRDPDFAFYQDLRQKIFWLDNSADDGLPAFGVDATAGHYFDMTLFGLEVTHQADGVPQFGHHPVADEPDLSLLTRFDFRRTGTMPGLLRMYERMGELAERETGGELGVSFPNFNRGPLDICMQICGYENFVAYMYERPDFALDFLDLVADERARWRRERRDYLGLEEPDGPRRIDDDWVNIPFITPELFRDFVAPVYERIRANEGPVTGWHTCGRFVPVAENLLAALPELETLEISGWNDFDRLDQIAPPDLPFYVHFKNAFVLTEAEDAHRGLLEQVAQLAERRPVSVCVQAIVNLCGTYRESLRRMNRFIRLARRTFAGRRSATA